VHPRLRVTDSLDEGFERVALDQAHREWPRAEERRQLAGGPPPGPAAYPAAYPGAYRATGSACSWAWGGTTPEGSLPQVPPRGLLHLGWPTGGLGGPHKPRSVLVWPARRCSGSQVRAPHAEPEEAPGAPRAPAPQPPGGEELHVGPGSQPGPPPRVPRPEASRPLTKPAGWALPGDRSGVPPGVPPGAPQPAGHRMGPEPPAPAVTPVTAGSPRKSGAVGGA